jgi:hypothetical protein
VKRISMYQTEVWPVSREYVRAMAFASHPMILFQPDGLLCLMLSECTVTTPTVELSMSNPIIYELIYY